VGAGAAVILFSFSVGVVVRVVCDWWGSASGC
jgi:hypothetical protein